MAVCNINVLLWLLSSSESGVWRYGVGSSLFSSTLDAKSVNISPVITFRTALSVERTEFVRGLR